MSEATAAAETTVSKLSKKDFVSDQEVRWCPGCGDYAILSALQKVLPEFGVPRENFVFISGIGCSSRFPYYMNTYGFHTIHGRATAIASGLKIARPELEVWVVTGDGDGMSIGGNHLIHSLRRNVDIKILLFNNRIYGLTKGQCSPTSETGKITKSTPLGSIDQPIDPIAIALGAEASFVARGIDVEAKHLQETLRRAHEHKGSTFVEILQNCSVFNDGAWSNLTEKATKADTQLVLEHGKPLIFGRNRDRGIRLSSRLEPEVVTLGNGVSESDLIMYDEHNPSLAYLLSRIEPPQFPTPIGVFLASPRPTYEQRLVDQVKAARDKLGEPDIDKLLRQGETWTVA